MLAYPYKTSNERVEYEMCFGTKQKRDQVICVTIFTMPAGVAIKEYNKFCQSTISACTFQERTMHFSIPFFPPPSSV